MEEKEEIIQDNKSFRAGWVKMKPDELEKIVLELAKEGNSPAKIGLILRDKYGIPRAKLLGKKITRILKDNGMPYKSEEDLVNVKISKLQNHVAKNKHDYCATRALTRRLWDIYHIKQK